MAHGWCVLLITVGLCDLYSSVPRQFHMVKDKRTWSEAQEYCREMFTDLATIHNMAEMENIKKMVQDAGVKYKTVGNNRLELGSWIGLKQGRWQWSLAEEGFYGDNETKFRNWAQDQPRPGNKDESDGQDCVSIHHDDQWYNYPCKRQFPFLCYDRSNSTHPHVLVNDAKNWTAAQRYCRHKHTDLVSVRSQAENDLIAKLLHGRDQPAADTGPHYREVWIGLFRDAWEWSDGSNSLFRHWSQGQPNYIWKSNHCGEVWVSGHWNDMDCNKRRRSICYQALPSATVVVMSPQTTPFYSGDVVTLRCAIAKFTDWRRYAWRKDGSTVPGKTSQIINISLPLEAGQYQCSGQREDRPMASSVSSPVNVINSDKLFLVSENKTWMEALRYCRKHHVDLVSVSSDQIQGWVQGWAIGASSPHVWISLRYECSFGFWFWTNGYSVCYENWASDAAREVGCEVMVGAVRRDGGQWDSLPETQELNFICTDDDDK